jgi:hypothetical protein
MHGFTLAGSAASDTWNTPIGVRIVKRMAATTLCQTGVQGRDAYSAQAVFSVCHRL